MISKISAVKKSCRMKVLLTRDGTLINAILIGLLGKWRAWFNKWRTPWFTPPPWIWGETGCTGSSRKPGTIGRIHWWGSSNERLATWWPETVSNTGEEKSRLGFTLMATPAYFPHLLLRLLRGTSKGRQHRKSGMFEKNSSGQVWDSLHTASVKKKRLSFWFKAGLDGHRLMKKN